MAIFQSFFLGSIGQKIVFYDILKRKNSNLGYKNKKFKNSKNWHFSKGVNPCFWSKSANFSNFFFLGNIGQEHVFYEILEGENAFLGYKNKKFKKRKSDIFRKGLTHGFRPNMAIFFVFLFGNRSPENLFYNIVEQQNAFLGYKNKKFKKSKNGHFSNFFFRQYTPRTCLLRYSRKRKRLSRV